MSTPSTTPATTPSSSPSSSPAPEQPGQPILDVLSQACEGLLFTSETDAPLKPFFWPDASPQVSAQSLARLASLAAGAAIEQQSVDEFLAPATAEEDWQNQDERATAQRFQALALVLRENLSGSVVFRVGETSIDVYILGLAEGGLAGLQTKVVET